MSTEDTCPECGSAAHMQAPDGCGHQAEFAAVCHRTGALPCPRHFAFISGEVLTAALNPVGFVDELKHLNDDGYIMAAYYTWMALLGRYALTDGTTVEDMLNMPVELPELTEGVPAYGRKVMRLVNYGSRAAVVGDAETVAATFAAVENELDGMSTLSFLKSVAASAHVAVDSNDACTFEHVQAFHYLGSQVGEGGGFRVLPLVVDMVMGQRAGDMTLAVKAFDKIIDVPDGGGLVSAVDILGRTLAQTTDPEVVVVSGDGEGMTGLLDIKTATADNTSRELMASVWAVRAAHAYGSAHDRHSATTNIRAVASSHPDGGFAFGVDMLLGGTQILSGLLGRSEDTTSAN